MRALYEQGAKPRVLSLFVAFCAVLFTSLMPHSAFAEDISAQITNPTDQTDDSSTVQSPGTPSATSPSNNHTIVWVWTPPVGAVIPAALPVSDSTSTVTQTDSSANQTPQETLQTQDTTDQPTDIIQYGYELSEAGTVMTSGIVSSTTPTVTTMVTEDGTYTLKVWSINRIAAISAPAIGTTTITTPPDPSTLPPIGKDIIPAPLNTTVLEKPASLTPASVSHPLLKQPASKVSSTPATSGVLAATDTNIPASPIENAVSAVQPSHQGWVILGVPWYIWVLSVGAAVMGGRWVVSFFRH